LAAFAALAAAATCCSLVIGGSAGSLAPQRPADQRRLVVLEFPTSEKTQFFYDSAEYLAARAWTH